MHMRNFKGSYSRKKNWLTIMHYVLQHLPGPDQYLWLTHYSWVYHFMNQALPLVPLRGLKLDRRTMLQRPVRLRTWTYPVNVRDTTASHGKCLNPDCNIPVCRLLWPARRRTTWHDAALSQPCSDPRLREQRAGRS
jgi:hypothetical protein